MAGITGNYNATSSTSFPSSASESILKPTLPQYGFGTGLTFEKLVESNRFLFRVYTPRPRSPFDDPSDPYFLAGKFQSESSNPSPDLTQWQRDEKWTPSLVNYDDVIQHMDWTTRSNSPFITTSFSFAWAMWEATKRYKLNVKQDVEIAVIDARMVKERAVTALEVLRDVPSQQKQQYPDFWKWYRFASESQDILVFGWIPGKAVLTSIPIKALLFNSPSYYLLDPPAALDAAAKPSIDIISRVAWSLGALSTSPPYSKSKAKAVAGSTYKQFCHLLTTRFLRQSPEHKVRESTIGAVRLALTFLRPWFTEQICTFEEHAPNDAYVAAIEALTHLALCVALWPAEWWISDHREVDGLIEAAVVIVAEEILRHRKKEAKEPVTPSRQHKAISVAAGPIDLPDVGKEVVADVKDIPSVEDVGQDVEITDFKEAMDAAFQLDALPMTPPPTPPPTALDTPRSRKRSSLQGSPVMPRITEELEPVQESPIADLANQLNPYFDVPIPAEPLLLAKADSQEDAVEQREPAPALLPSPDIFSPTRRSPTEDESEEPPSPIFPHILSGRPTFIRSNLNILSPMVSKTFTNSLTSQLASTSRDVITSPFSLLTPPPTPPPASVPRRVRKTSKGRLESEASTSSWPPGQMDLSWTPTIEEEDMMTQSDKEDRYPDSDDESLLMTPPINGMDDSIIVVDDKSSHSTSYFPPIPSLSIDQIMDRLDGSEEEQKDDLESELTPIATRFDGEAQDELPLEDLEDDDESLVTPIANEKAGLPTVLSPIKSTYDEAELEETGSPLAEESKTSLDDQACNDVNLDDETDWSLTIARTSSLALTGFICGVFVTLYVFSVHRRQMMLANMLS